MGAMTAPSGTEEAPDTELGRRMDDRRNDLDLTWDEVAALSGLSRQTLFDIRKGHTDYRRMRTSTKRKIEKALQWNRATVDVLIDLLAAGAPDAGEPEPEADDSSMAEEDSVRFEVMKNAIRADTLTPRLRLELLKYLYRSAGSELTLDRLMMWLEDPNRLDVVRPTGELSETEQATEGDRS